MRRRCAHGAPARAVMAAVAATTATALAACAGAPAPGPTALPDGVSVAFVQLRSDVAERQAQVEVFNGTDASLEVAEVGVADPHFAGPALRALDRVTRIPAGGTVDIRVQLPPVACPAGGTPGVVSVRFAQGEVEGTAAVPLVDPLGFVPRLHERECRAAAVAEAADVSFTEFRASDAGAPASLVLSIVPHTEPARVGDVDITGIRPTNLLTFRESAGDVAGIWPLDVHIAAGDATPLVRELPLVPLRCDPHAVQEDKRGTVFVVDVVVDGVAGTIELPAGEELRGRLLGWVTEWCAADAG